MKNLILAISIFVSLSFAIEANAQKFGYINATQLLVELPEVKAADEQLLTYQNGLIAKGQEMVQALETEYNAYIEEANTGALSQVQMQQKEGAMSVKQQEIQQYEQQVQNMIGTKRQELYQPILDKVNKVIETIGKEEGYTMIFDSSTGSILSSNAGDDISAKVKAKLGL